MRTTTTLAALWDRMIASDPGLLRLTLALRGTCSVFLTAATVTIIATVLGAEPVELAVGVVFSMVAPFLSREPTRRQRQHTLLILVVPAAAASVLTTLLHSRGPLGEVYFLALVFAASLLQARDVRGMAIGLVAVVVSYVGLYLELPLRSLSLQLLSLGVGLAMAWVACFHLVPFRPAAVLHRTVQAVQARAALVLRHARAIGAGEPDKVQALRRSLARLNEVALAADDQFSLLYPEGSLDLRRHLMDLELAAARLATLPVDALVGQAARRYRARLRVHERRLNRARWSRQTRSASPGSAASGPLADIARAARALATVGSAPPARPTVTPPPPGPFAWQMAIRVTVASAAAMAGGLAISPQRWFWAVLAAYIIFLNTRSRGDAIFRGVQRVGGTLLGLVGGLILAASLSDMPAAEIVVLFAAIFGMYYLILISYTLGILCVTLLLGLIYSLLGVAMGPLLALRLEETAVGAVCAILTALFVVPVRTRDQIGQSGAAVLRALAEVVATCRRVLAGEPGLFPLPAMRAVDRQVADLRLALLPLTAGRALLRRTAAERPVPALLECVHWARVLAVSVDAPDAAAARRAGSIARTLSALAAGGQADAQDRVPAETLPPGQVGGALDQLDRATSALAERMAIGALHGFRLEG